MLRGIVLFTISLLLCSITLTRVNAQPKWTIDLMGKEKKPEQFTERKLGSERLADKKFNIYRRVVQNNFTHFNYYYNANNKLTLILERAKDAQKDDYTKIISYYPYSLENTAMQKQDLDSIILKSTAGILLHDLRNAWIDDMYMLMGKAYFLRKDFDSAALTFQFINYNLFPRKKNEDEDRIVGTADDAAGNKISIANKEKPNIFQKLTAKPPSRNDALIWMIRTLIEQDEMFDAASLINTLQNDPNLPKRLQDDLNDVNGYWFFKQGIYDSAAVYLEKGLTNAETKQDLARSEYLLAQLYELNNQYDKASLYYDKASAHTTNALMDIHAQMNNAKMKRSNNEKDLNDGINNLIRLGKKDKFEAYRDVLYYSAGALCMQKPDTTLAIDLFKRSIKFNEENPTYRNKAFLQLADIAYSRKQFKDAFNMYDSLQVSDTTLKDELEKLKDRRNALLKITEKIFIIEKQDSILRIAAMEPAAREAYVKKLSKKLRKERGIKEDDQSTGGSDIISFDKDKDQPRDLFSNSDSKSGDWYFYNKSLKSKGFTDFKRKWGARTNTDNWRRKAALSAPSSQEPDKIAMISSMNPDDIDAPAPQIADAGNNPQGQGRIPTDSKGNGKNNRPINKVAAGEANSDQPEDYSYEGLMAGLPLTDEKKAICLTLIAENMYQLGKLFQQDLEDYGEALRTYDSSLNRFPDSLYNGELYANMSFCYTKLGMNAEADHYKKLLDGRFPGSQAGKLLSEMKAAKASSGKKNPEATKSYESIYNLFIEGKFEDALAEKKKADSLFGNSYWTPQLLYIEAVYHVKQKEDSLATDVLKNIVSLYPKSPLKPKAERMIDVLKRRKEIEDYLTNLQITRAKDDSVIVVNDRKPMVRNDATIIQPQKNATDSAANKASATQPIAKTDSATAKVPAVSGPYSFKADNRHMVLMLLDKVDPTYVKESRNALSRYANDYFREAQLEVSKDTISKELSVIIFSSFENAEQAMLFLTKVKKAAPEEISWLPANKYSFVMIDDDNLQRMKSTKDIAGYKALLAKLYPGKF